MSPEETTRPEHWLHTVPDDFGDLHREVERLQMTIRALIAINAVSEAKAEKAYEIAGWR